MISRHGFVKSCVVIALCATGNNIVGMAFGLFPTIPLFMDSIFTVVAALYGGIVPGLLTGLLTNVDSTIINTILGRGSGLQYLYFLCNMATAVVVCVFSGDRLRLDFRFRDLLLLSVLVAVANSVLGGIIATCVYHDLEFAPADYIFVGMILQNFPATGAAILSRIPINLADKLIAVVAGYGIARGVEAIEKR